MTTDSSFIRITTLIRHGDKTTRSTLSDSTCLEALTPEQIQALQSSINQAIDECVLKSMGCQNVEPSEPLTSSKLMDLRRKMRQDYPEPVPPPIPLHDSVLSALTSSVPDNHWLGLSAECCLALNWPLSTENLAVVNRSLRWIFVQQYPAGLPGAMRTAQSEDLWSTFAQKVLADSRSASVPMLEPTTSTSLNCLGSSQTLRTY